ncbi:hypothetical protein N7G274_009677 [Stereocaulon virgatum]|uniref:Uncharacterized protein n=1 Tax=Stereocaulon virgatum TaxID=373712 RepID=A0ABR3ZYE6_9LECA
MLWRREPALLSIHTYVKTSSNARKTRTPNIVTVIGVRGQEGLTWSSALFLVHVGPWDHYKRAVYGSLPNVTENHRLSQLCHRIGAAFILILNLNTIPWATIHDIILNVTGSRSPGWW